MTRAADRLREGIAALSRPPAKGRGDTSDLSVDEVLLLHADGWEPAGLVYGASEVAIPPGAFWQLGAGGPPSHVGVATTAVAAAFDEAVRKLHHGCTQMNGAGVVGVDIDFDMAPHHVTVQLTGSAIRRIGAAGPSSGGNRRAPANASGPFLSDLSARDFTLLERAGWLPVGLAYGAGFVNVPRRQASTALSQMGQNVELEAYTQGLYSARESALGGLQKVAATSGGTGVVGVSVDEGPLPFAHHVIGFRCWGTTVRLGAESHQRISPRTVIELDDPVVEFAAESLR